MYFHWNTCLRHFRFWLITGPGLGANWLSCLAAKTQVTGAAKTQFLKTKHCTACYISMSWRKPQVKWIKSQRGKLPEFKTISCLKSTRAILAENPEAGNRKGTESCIKWVCRLNQTCLVWNSFCLFSVSVDLLRSTKMLPSMSIFRIHATLWFEITALHWLKLNLERKSLEIYVSIISAVFW